MCKIAFGTTSGHHEYYYAIRALLSNAPSVFQAITNDFFCKRMSNCASYCHHNKWHAPLYLQGKFIWAHTSLAMGPPCQLLQSKYWWNGMLNNIHKFISSYTTCPESSAHCQIASTAYTTPTPMVTLHSRFHHRSHTITVEHNHCGHCRPVPSTNFPTTTTTCYQNVWTALYVCVKIYWIPWGLYLIMELSSHLEVRDWLWKILDSS